jgi:hypothetical protein
MDAGRRSVPFTRHLAGVIGRRIRLPAGYRGLDPDTLYEEFRRRGVTFAKALSFIDDGLWGFELADADGYILAFFRLRND